ncbi:MAG: YhdH/YhfP family quinone oxidoreductase [Salibacteraceae bacterium]
MSNRYKALVVRENPDGSFSRNIEEKSIDELPAGDVLIKSAYAGLNYKDALSANGHKGITRQYPHTPGIDVSGVVVESASDQFKTGDKVLVTGYDFGMNTSGGFQEYVRVPAGWVVPLPEGLNLYEAMVYGTAGFTAALCMHKMQLIGQSPDMGEFLVTGASGGVGSMAVGIFSKCGFTVVASTGKKDAHDHLKNLGAKRIEDRNYANDTSGKPLLRSKWAGAVDTVGGNTLATCVKACKRRGSVASCGLVASHELHMTVYPFLLNGVNILGIDSAETEMPLRKNLWQHLSTDWKIDNLESYGSLIQLEDLPHYIDLMLQGKTKGRIVVKFSD